MVRQAAGVPVRDQQRREHAGGGPRLQGRPGHKAAAGPGPRCGQARRGGEAAADGADQRARLEQALPVFLVGDRVRDDAAAAAPPTAPQYAAGSRTRCLRSGADDHIFLLSHSISLLSQGISLG